MKMSEVWYTSDVHFFHKMVAGLRGYEATDAGALQNNEEICDHINDTVRKDDQIYFLGDMTSGSQNSEAAMLDIVRRLPGEHHLILGNHDSPHPCKERQSHKYLRQWNDSGAFASIQIAARKKIAGKYVFFSHFPKKDDHVDPPRYVEWRMDNLQPEHWLVHGHTHDVNKFHDGREIHVGWDAWRRLVNQEEIAQLITEQLKEES
jgi:calcineurin-like phosphoesterase family protein